MVYTFYFGTLCPVECWCVIYEFNKWAYWMPELVFLVLMSNFSEHKIQVGSCCNANYPVVHQSASDTSQKLLRQLCSDCQKLLGPLKVQAIPLIYLKYKSSRELFTKYEHWTMYRWQVTGKVSLDTDKNQYAALHLIWWSPVRTRHEAEGG